MPEEKNDFLVVKSPLIPFRPGFSDSLGGEAKGLTRHVSTKKQIRQRSHVDADYNKTIAATDMSKEALNDWGLIPQDNW